MKENKILEIKYYVLPFFVFTFILLVFQNLYLFLGVLFLFLLVYAYISYKYKNINFISILFLIAFLTLASYSFFMFKTYNSLDWYNKSFIKKDYKVVDILRWWKYLVQDDLWWDFILYNAKDKYNYSENITIYGMIYSIKLPYKNFHDFKKNKFLSTNIQFSNIEKIFNFDYTNYLIMKGISWNIYAKKIYKKHQDDIPFYKNIKSYIKNKIDNIYVKNNYKALVLWILIWDKSYLSDKIYHEFIYSWLVHIIVVSWWNIMLLIIFLSFFLFFLPFYVRIIVIWIFVIIYSMVVGFDSSVIRATIMWILSLIALFFGRLADTKRFLGIAFIFMLIINPYFLIYDLGFVLSFLAILWILAFNSFKITWKGYIKWLSYSYNNYVLPTLWASLFTAPAILLFTNKVNALAFISGILVVPFVPILMLVNIFLLVFHGTFLGPIWYEVSIHIMDWIFYVSYLFWDKFTYFIHI